MPTITPRVSYRVHPNNCFEIHYPDITKAQKLNTITVPIKTFSFKQAGIHAIILGYISKNILDPDFENNRFIMKSYYDELVGILSGVPELNKINNKEILAIFIQHFRPNAFSLDNINDYIGDFDVTTFNNPKLYTESEVKPRSKASKLNLLDPDKFTDIIKRNVAQANLDIVCDAINDYVAFKLRSQESEFIESHQHVGVLQEEIERLKADNKHYTSIYIEEVSKSNELTAKCEDLEQLVHSLNNHPIRTEICDADLKAENQKLRNMYSTLQESTLTISQKNIRLCDEVDRLKADKYDKFHEDYIQLLKAQMDQNNEHNQTLCDALSEIDLSLCNISNNIG